MASTRNVKVVGIFASAASTVIPPTPIQGVAYRNAALVAAGANAGWPYAQKVDSATYNQILYSYSTLLAWLESWGVTGYTDLTDYAPLAVVMGSDNKEYICIQANGPTTAVQDPTSATAYWVLKRRTVIPRAVATGTGDAVVVDFKPDATPLVDGDLVQIQHTAANTGAMTINPDGAGAVTTYKAGGVALVAGDVPGADFWGLYIYDASLASFQMLNPATGIKNLAPMAVIDATVAANALTISFAGGVVDFRNAAINNGAVTTATVPPLTFTIPSGTNVGTVSGKPVRLWVYILNNGGTYELGAINTQIIGAGGEIEIAPVNESTLISTTAVAGGTAAGVFYSQTARAAVPFHLAGYIECTQAAAGTWATAPSVKQGMAYGVRKPGEVIQTRRATYNVFSNSAAAVMNYSDVVPVITDGAFLMSKAIIITNAINALGIRFSGPFGKQTSAQAVMAAAFQDATANAVAADFYRSGDSVDANHINIDQDIQAGVTGSTTISIRYGAAGANIVYVNGPNTGRIGGGKIFCRLELQEIQA